MTSHQQYAKIAQSLPPRLLRFFARYPPPAIQQCPQTTAAASPSMSGPPQDTTVASGLPASNPRASSEEHSSPISTLPNPFRAQKHPVTGRWHDPVFSLRRQADLVKLARKHGVEELLPYTVKGTEAKLKKREENGLRVKGTGIGQRVKGKGWERTMKGRYVYATPLFSPVADFCCHG